MGHTTTIGSSGGASRRHLLKAGAGLAAGGLALGGFPAVVRGALDGVTFGTNWRAQAEHGGFYQAVAKGIYGEHGLDVTIRPGGPQVNNTQLLAAGRIDFNMGGNSFTALNYVQNGLPFLAVAAIFQKDPQALIAHPGRGHDDLESLKGEPIMISTGVRITLWRWLQARYGYTDDQIRPYTFSLAPFLADPDAIQQGYVTSEPYAIRQAGVEPVIMLLADRGFNGYSTTIDVGRRTVEERPDLVRRFVDASVLGWVDYLYGDPAPGNALIRRDNPEMTDDLIAYGIRAMRDYGIVDSGDSLERGIGAMTR
ncbi:MAG TPA: ABC transporter substrate-binding protein, partial [Geminicoccaceae bacterium]|nr:ABC transporter substrate-binding protein [Geminicoccaceae bacterium]